MFLNSPPFVCCTESAEHPDAANRRLPKGLALPFWHISLLQQTAGLEAELSCLCASATYVTLTPFCAGLKLFMDLAGPLLCMHGPSKSPGCPHKGLLLTAALTAQCNVGHGQQIDGAERKAGYGSLLTINNIEQYPVWPFNRSLAAAWPGCCNLRRPVNVVEKGSLAPED